MPQSPTALVFILGALATCGCRKTPEAYLLPAGYRGPVYVFHDQEEPREREGGRWVYHVGSDGVALTAFPFEAGVVDSRYYYVTDQGDRCLINWGLVQGSGGTPAPVCPDSTLRTFVVSSGSAGSPSGRIDYTRSFVGSIAEYEAFVAPDSTGPTDDVRTALERRGLAW